MARFIAFEFGDLRITLGAPRPAGAILADLAGTSVGRVGHRQVIPSAFIPAVNARRARYPPPPGATQDQSF